MNNDLRYKLVSGMTVAAIFSLVGAGMYAVFTQEERQRERFEQRVAAGLVVPIFVDGSTTELQPVCLKGVGYWYNSQHGSLAARLNSDGSVAVCSKEGAQ